ncbi:MAG: hypothetical protein NW214_04065 [Pseudanabaenaceae cyanobacterium bins.39]|nr:hypothetical protein [Pseudanabaenaceae cyanobacterium bins.39]
MNTQDIIAILALGGTIISTIFMLGQQAQKINEASKDLDHLFNKVRENSEELAKLEKAFIRTEQRVTFLEDRLYGEETIGRMRDR